MAALIKGYKIIVTVPEKNSDEKENTLKALGAEVIRTPTEAPIYSPKSHFGVAAQLNSDLPNSHILDQHVNPSNALAHYETTAEEIIEACEGNVDYIFIATGTGGTITGVSRRIKETLPNCQVIGVDP
jgi:cystathionine beta-synthase